MKQQEIINGTLKNHQFLTCMYGDSYFPTFLVDKCSNVLIDLCHQIEKENPKDLEALYRLSHAATEKLNALEDEFFENDSEIETGARECLAMDFQFIAKTYGFDADIEELIANRNW